jgi:hypothetical protein
VTADRIPDLRSEPSVFRSVNIHILEYFVWRGRRIGRELDRAITVLPDRHELTTLAYLAATIGLFVYQWTRPGLFNPWLYPLSLFLSFTAAVISHNHNHVGLWRWPPLNLVTSYAICGLSKRRSCDSSLVRVPG